MLIWWKSLNIKNTDIDSGLEYLPASLTLFYCGVTLPQSLTRELKKYGEPKKYSDDTYDYIELIKQWRQANQELLAKATKQKEGQKLKNQVEVPPKSR